MTYCQMFAAHFAVSFLDKTVHKFHPRDRVKIFMGSCTMPMLWDIVEARKSINSTLSKLKSLRPNLAMCPGLPKFADQTINCMDEEIFTRHVRVGTVDLYISWALTSIKLGQSMIPQLKPGCYCYVILPLGSPLLSLPSPLTTQCHDHLILWLFNLNKKRKSFRIKFHELVAHRPGIMFIRPWYIAVIC